MISTAVTNVTRSLLRREACYDEELERDKASALPIFPAAERLLSAAWELFSAKSPRADLKILPPVRFTSGTMRTSNGRLQATGKSCWISSAQIIDSFFQVLPTCRSERTFGSAEDGGRLRCKSPGEILVQYGN
jgi:hypothetical protein